MTRLLHGVNVVSITVTDLERARRFYGDTLGLGEPWFDDDAMGWVEWGEQGANGNLAVTRPVDGAMPGGGTTAVLNTSDCWALVATLRERGVRCDDPVVVPGLLVVCTFYDPDGNRLQAISNPP
jgi:catechol 2,3-dioxygenase-like lactoylglutathione lyase family enzyme